MKKILKNKKIWIFLGIVLIFFGSMTKVEYTSDSYLFFKETWDKPFYHFLGLGRFLSGFLWLSLCKTNFNVMYIVSYTISIIVTTLSLYKLDELLKRDIKNGFVSGIISVLIVINPFSLELMLFYEKSILMLSVLFNILAVKKLDDAFSSNKKKDYLLVFIYMVLAYFSYQGTVALFLSLGVIYILKYSKNIKDFFIKNIQVGLLYAIPAIINYIPIKFIFKTSRMEGTLTISEKILMIYNSLKEIIFKTSDVFPKYFFLIVLGIASIALIVKIIKSKNTGSKKAIYIVGFIYIILANIISTSAPQVLQNWVSIVPRNAYSIGASVGIIWAYLCMNFEVKDILKNIIITTSMIFLLMQLISFNEIIIGHYQTNAIDANIAEQIRDKVYEYENEKNTRVKYMVLYSDTNKATMYKNIRYYGDVNIKAYANSWGTRGILDWKLEREIIDDTSNEEKYNKYKANFEEKNWDYFDINEQVIIDEDTLYLCVY